MSTAASRSWLASLLLAAVMALALAPQLARAHGGYAHEQQAVPESPAVERPAAMPGIAALLPAPTALSQPCSGGSGGNCCCTRPSFHTTGAKAAIVNTGGWTRPASLPVRWSRALPAELLLQSQVALSPALPRAPPFFS